MELNRDRLVAALNNVASLSRKTGYISIIGAGIGIYKYGMDWFMIFQIALSLILITVFLFGFHKVKANVNFNRKAVRNSTDISSILFSGFYFAYYGVYHGYLIFTDFHWTEILFTLAGIIVAFATFQNASGFNILLQNIEKFKLNDTIEVSDEEWENLVSKYNLE